MNLTIDLNTIVQGVLVTVLTGVGAAVWRASIAIAVIVADLKAHKEHTNAFQDDVQQDIRELRVELGRRPMTRPNGGWS